jgi:hypothetical protein
MNFSSLGCKFKLQFKILRNFKLQSSKLTRLYSISSKSSQLDFHHSTAVTHNVPNTQFLKVCNKLGLIHRRWVGQTPNVQV